MAICFAWALVNEWAGHSTTTAACKKLLPQRKIFLTPELRMGVQRILTLGAERADEMPAPFEWAGAPKGVAPS